MKTFTPLIVIPLMAAGFMLTSGLLAENSVPLDAKLVSGPITLECNYVDMSQWGGVFALVATHFRCMVLTSATDTESVTVTIETIDSAGVTHEKTQSSPMQNGATMVLFPTTDRILGSVSVAEAKVPVRFTRER